MYNEILKMEKLYPNDTELGAKVRGYVNRTNERQTLTVLMCVHSFNATYDYFLHQALQSLEMQTYKDFKVLLILDGCWSNTITMVRNNTYKLKLEIVERPNKQGLAFAKNHGLSLIDTELVAYLDCDDYYLPEKLEKQINYFRNNDVDFLATETLLLNNNNFMVQSWELGTYETDKAIKQNIFQSNFLAHGTFMIKKKALDEIGGYNHVIGMEDWDLWKRAATANYKFHQLPERLYVFRMNTSVSR